VSGSSVLAVSLRVLQCIVVPLALVAMAPAAGAFDLVSIPAAGFNLQAAVLRPAGPGPFPVVVGLHGCSGLGNRRAMVEPRLHDWGERLVAAGYAVVFPDSFGSRGVGQQCTARERQVRPGIERVADAQTVRRWLLEQPWARPDRLFLMGWSNGGSTTLWAVRPQQAPKDGKPDFRAAVAFYPGCRPPAQRGWRTRLSLLLLIGDADDWTPADACTAMIETARNGSAPIDYVAYPGALHAFDHPNLPPRQRRGLAFTRDGSGTAWVGTDPKARADAIARVLAWLAR
jgi:dienelactone hydrolase